MSGHDEDDEALSAFLDGALSSDDVAALRRRLSADPALARRLEELRGVDSDLRAAYGGIVNEPLPRTVVDLLERKGGSDRARVKPRFDVRWFAWPSVALSGLAAGFLVALLILRSPQGPAGLLAGRADIEARSALHAALETLPSGQTRDLGHEWSATPQLTFVSTEGVPCRRVDLSGPSTSIDAIVCRRGSSWRTELLGYASARGATPDQQRYRPATGDAPSRIDDAINSMMKGSPLGRDAEGAWIRSGWREQH